jgi:hypothetical protein
MRLIVSRNLYFKIICAIEMYRQKLKTDLQTVWRSKKQIREMLHPTLDKEHLPKTENNPLKVIMRLTYLNP